MPSRYSIDERALCACWFHETKSITAVQRKFRKERNTQTAPARKSILCWCASLFSTGSILDKKRERPRIVRTEEMENAVVGVALSKPNISIRRLSVLFSISQTSIHRMLHDFKLHPYKLQMVQKLHENDRHLRMTFCHEEIARMANDPHHIGNLLHSDEANFHLSGAVNKQNFRYWASKNPRWVTEEPLHSPKMVV